MRKFDEWLATFRESINTFSYYVDYSKIRENMERRRKNLAEFNVLLGSKNIEHDFRELIKVKPYLISEIPSLLALRQKDVFACDDEVQMLVHFGEDYSAIDDIVLFLDRTGVFDMLATWGVTNIVDYILGVEVGLDSNARKNRGGHQMENLVEHYLQQAGFDYHKEMRLKDVESEYAVDLSSLSNAGRVVKRFDFVFKHNETVYLVETNFYSSGGSKLNETARSYKMITEETSNIPSVEFLWVTDGKGWNSARNNLEETFDVLTHLYNIKDLENGVLKHL